MARPTEEGVAAEKASKSSRQGCEAIGKTAREMGLGWPREHFQPGSPQPLL